jgi:hypothetical protein
MDDFQKCEVLFISQRHGQWQVRIFIHLDMVFSAYISTPLTRQNQQACLNKQNTIISHIMARRRGKQVCVARLPSHWIVFRWGHTSEHDEHDPNVLLVLHALFYNLRTSSTFHLSAQIFPSSPEIKRTITTRSRSETFSSPSDSMMINISWN